MKYSLLILSLLAGGMRTATAQLAEVSATAAPAVAPEDAKPPLLIGFTGGLVTSSLLGSDAINARYRTSVHGGLTADLPLTHRFVLHTEALYTQKGVRYSSESDVRNAVLSYAELPVLARYYSQPTAGTNSWFMEFGPRVSALLAAHNDNAQNTKSAFKDIDAGFILGAGFRAGNGIGIGFRYDVGITSTYREIPTAASAGRGDFQPNSRNDAFFLSLSFPLWMRSAAAPATEALPQQP